jgi:hypothetical protein
MRDTNPLRTGREIAAMSISIRAGLPDALAAMNEAQSLGYPTNKGGSGGGSSLNDAGKPAGLEKYLGADDPARDDLRQITALLRTIHFNARLALDLVGRWTTTAPGVEGGRALPAKTKSDGNCVACSAYCTGSEDDRLRSGLCNPCRVSLHRYTNDRRGDRHDWLLERRRSIEEESAA